MNTHRPLHFAAALLLGLGCALAQAQEAPSNPFVGVQPAGHLIERFGLMAGSVVLPGREVHYVLFGQPGGRAWVDIPGSRSGIPLQEVRPGQYQGGYVVSPLDNPDSVARAFGALQLGGVTTTTQATGTLPGYTAPPRVADPGRAPRAAHPPGPVISEVTPAQGQRVTGRGPTRITARVADGGAGIDRRSLVMRVDGRDVTRYVRFDGDYVEYLEDLERGRHSVEIVARDRRGNATRAAWSFEVEGRRRY